MLLTIHNLPSHTRYTDIKQLLLSKCGFSEVILDNLVIEGKKKTKKVTVGLADEADAAILSRNINGLYLEGMQLYVEDVRQKASEQQPYYKSNSEPANTQQQGFQQMNYPVQYPGYGYGMPMGYAPQGNFDNQQGMGPNAMAAMMMPPMMGGMYFMPPGQQNYNMDFTGQGQAASSQYSQFPQVGSGVDSGTNRFQDDRSYDSRPDTNRSSYNNGQSHSTNQRQSRWDNKERYRSRSPQHGRSRESRWSPNRSRNDQYRERDDRRDDQPLGFQRYGSNSNGAQGSTNLPINQKLLSISNMQTDSMPSASARNPWENNQRSQNNARDRPSNSNSQARIWEAGAAPAPYQNQAQNQDRAGSNWAGPAFNSSKFQPGNSWSRDNNEPLQSRKRKSRFDEGPAPSFVRRNAAPQPQKAFNSGNRNNNFQSHHETPAPGTSYQNKKLSRSEARALKPNQPGGQPPPKINRLVEPGKMGALIREDDANRAQATDRIVSEMLKGNPDNRISDAVLANLTRAVRSRIEILMATQKVGMMQVFMVDQYRLRFPVSTDKKLLDLVVNATKSGFYKTSSAGPSGSKPTVKQPTMRNPAPKAQPAPAKPAKKKQEKVTKNVYFYGGEVNIPQLLPPAENMNLPKFPNSDKELYKTLKKLQQAEVAVDNYYEDQMMAKYPLEEAALISEAETLVEIFKSELENLQDPQEKKVGERILASGKALQDFRKGILLHISKRILNVKSNLMFRMFISGKRVRKAPLSQFLKKHGVVAMRESVGNKFMYVLTCDSFEAYDKLAAVKSLQYDENSILNLKPFQMLGPTSSIHDRRAQMKQARTNAKIAKKKALEALANNPGMSFEFSNDEDDDDEDDLEAGGDFDEIQDNDDVEEVMELEKTEGNEVHEIVDTDDDMKQENDEVEINEDDFEDY